MAGSNLRHELSIYTVGHSNTLQDAFIELIRSANITVLADVRSQPYSRYASQFNAPELKAAVSAAGIEYVYVGRELGGRPHGSEYYDADGHVRYDLVAESEIFLAGVALILDKARDHRLAIMCSEEDPSGCHRRLLVGRVLADRGISVRHLRGDGRVQTDDDFADETQSAQQLSLFGDEEVKPWRSIRSVLQKKPPPSSSDY